MLAYFGSKFVLELIIEQVSRPRIAACYPSTDSEHGFSVTYNFLNQQEAVPFWTTLPSVCCLQHSFFLILLSAFFSGSETGLMTLNRYRLRHLASKKHPGAMRTQKLLQRQDRLIGLILLGNNFVNVLASILMTLITLRIYNDTGLVFAAGMLLTIVILLFAEVTPKTLAALHPERIAYPAAFVYTPSAETAVSVRLGSQCHCQRPAETAGRVSRRPAFPCAHHRGTAHRGDRGRGPDSETSPVHAA